MKSYRVRAGSGEVGWVSADRTATGRARSNRRNVRKMHKFFIGAVHVEYLAARP
jgi:hypothetical protein